MWTLKDLACLVIVLCLGGVALSAGANASEVGDPRIGLNADQIAELSDAELRKRVVATLNAQQRVEPETFNPADIAYAAQTLLTTIRTRLGEIFGSYTELPAALSGGIAVLMDGRDAGGIGSFLIVFLIAIGAAVLAEFAVAKVFPKRPQPAGAPTLAQKARVFLAVWGGAIRNILAFAAAGTVVFFVIGTSDARDRVTFAFYFSAIVLFRLLAATLSAYLAPNDSSRRIPLYGDGEALGFRNAVLLTIGLTCFSFFTCAQFSVLGVGGDAHYLFLMSVGLVLTIGLMLSFTTFRDAITQDLTVQAPKLSDIDAGDGAVAYGVRNRLAQAYPWLLAVLVPLLFFGLVSYGVVGGTPLFGAGLVTVLLAFLWPSLDAACERDALRAQESGDAVTPAIVRVVRLLLAVVVFVTFAIAWRLNILSGAQSGLGAAVARALFETGVIALIAYTAWQILTIWIDRKIAEEKAKAGPAQDISEMEIGGPGLSRIATLLPLFKRSGQATIGIIALMLALSSLGVSIGPLLAGAGVVGLAIGFGSQTLIRDIVSGAFFLIDDAFRQGEYVDLGKVKGSVERISVRSLQLRHHRGALHTIPFGEIATITNYSRDWIIMKLKFRVSFDADIEKIRKVIKKVGQSLLEHDDIKDDFLQPLKSQGVVEADDYGLIIRMKFMSKPGRQFIIRRYVFSAVQTAFQENGIEFSRPELRVAVGDEADDDLPPEVRQAAASGGAAAITAVNRPAQAAPAAAT